MFKPVEKQFDLVAFEHEVLGLWDEIQAFEKLRARNAGGERWSFLDGPITANNPMGVHHAWGRTLKDAYQRYHAMRGFDQRYQNGFDCQGLWVEVEVEKELGFESKRDIEEYGLDKFINACKDRVRKYSQVQTDQSIRLGYWMDWDNSYFTMADENNYTIWGFLKKCHDRGLIYKGLDAMPWCPRCGTGISEQETKEGYRTIKDQAVFVKLRLVNRPGEHILVWTTTPWTLAANVACAVNPELSYAKVRQGDDVYYLSAELLSILGQKGPHEVLEELTGKDMLGWAYEGPFDDLEAPGSVREHHRVVPWDEVSATDGTGIVHIAPGCGKEDFLLGKELGLPVLGPISSSGQVLGPIDDGGRYTAGYGFLQGKHANDVGDEVLEALRERGCYYKKESYEHSYPHCWRCKTKLLFRAVEEWYIKMDWRDEIKDVVRQIEWIPEYGEDQELNWLTNMGDWMISKKRYWGLALPIFDCEACGHFEVIGSREELQGRAVEGWAQFDGNSPHRPWIDDIKIACGKCGNHVSRIEDVGNPWLDAGIVPYSTVKYNTDREYWQKWMPADLVLECFPGQFRNWFYALLAMSTMMENVPPFKTLLGHALVMDENGDPMSKSGNNIEFKAGAEKMGVDAMRWLYCRQNPTQNLNFGYGVTDQIKRKVFNTWWNVYSFFTSYALADEFDPTRERVPLVERQDMDRWLLSKLQELIRTANEKMPRYDSASLVREAEDFLDSLSTWWLRRCRRRFWRAKNTDDRDKLAAYQTLYDTLVTFGEVMAPIVPFITEKLYQNLVRAVDPAAPESVHHRDYPQFDESLHDEDLAREMDFAMRVVSTALSVREGKSLRVRQPLAHMTVITSDAVCRRAVERFQSHILDELNIKAVNVQGDFGGLAEHSVQPNGRLLGPKYGQKMGAIGKALREQDAALVAAQVRAGEIITLEVGEDRFELLPEEVLVRTSFPDHLAAGEERSFSVVLDVQLTPELEREGYSRDVIRHIQTIRKDLDLELTDRIRITYETTSETLAAAIEEHRDNIMGETLCSELTQGTTASGVVVTLSGQHLTLEVQRA